jgi:Reverse transcriptase (RNA-dependent DNA polymerase)
MKSSISEFKNLVIQSTYDVILLAETWFSDDVMEGELSIQNYSIFRSDRSLNTSTKSRGGGVMILVNNKLQSKILSSSIYTVEQLFVEVKTASSAFIFCCVYIPPNSVHDVYSNHCIAVEEMVNNFQNHKLIICGDYNLPLAVWSNGVLGVSVECSETSPASIVCECFSFLNLYQLNNIPNSRGVYLDLIFSHFDSVKVNSGLDLLHHNSIHHTAYTFDLSLMGNNPELDFEEVVYDFNRADFYAINYYLASVDWSNYLCKTDINLAVAQFYDVIYSAMEMFIPLRTLKKSSYPQWYSSELKSIIICKKKMHKLYKESESPDHYLQFSALRNRCKELTQQCYENYLRRIESNISVDARSFWGFANAKRGSNAFPSEMFLSNEVASIGTDIADLFADHFSAVYSNSDCIIPQLDNSNQVNLSNCVLSLVDVYCQIEKGKSTLSCGPDGVPSFFVKQCICTISTPLYLLFNISLQLGVFPLYWKNAFIRPIYKSGERQNIVNYRGISIPSFIPKLLDGLVTAQISWHCRNIFVDEQHGFLSGRSTVTNLMLYQKNILDAFEKRCQVHSIYTDFSKAFDRVNHSLLINKLKCIGFDGSFLSWINSFLVDRTQWVKINNYVSKSIAVKSGVPQGSHCGPYLFNLFINDIGSYISYSDFLLFADDLKIYKVIQSPSDCLELQNDLNGVLDWCSVNCMDLNINKCFFMPFTRSLNPISFSYSINGLPLTKLTVIKDLGVTFDTKLTFSNHNLLVAAKARSLLGFVCRIGRDLSVTSLKTIYCSLLRSHLEYAVCIWSPYYDLYINSIESVQNRFLRICAYKIGFQPGCYSLSDVRNILNLHTLESRRSQADLCFLFRLLSGMINCPSLLQSINFRWKQRETRDDRAVFSLMNHRTNYAFNCPLSRILRLANTVDLNLFGNSFSSFRNSIKPILDF